MGSHFSPGKHAVSCYFASQLFSERRCFWRSTHTVPSRRLLNQLSQRARLWCCRLSGPILHRWARGEPDKRGNSSLNQCWLIITTGGGERGFPVCPIPPGSPSPPSNSQLLLQALVFHSSSVISSCVCVCVWSVILKMMEFTRWCRFSLIILNIYITLFIH